MLSEENLERMYDAFIYDDQLTIERINACDVSIDDLFSYGKKLLSNKQYGKAMNCFKKCYELDPYHLEACLQLFLNTLKYKNYVNSFAYLARICTMNYSDRNFYLYLLSMVTNLPKKYRDEVKAFKFEDIELSSDGSKDFYAQIQNKVRNLSWNQKFLLAGRQHYFFRKQTRELSVSDEIIETLLSQAVVAQVKFNENMKVFVSAKRYHDLIDYLQLVENQHVLSIKDQAVLFLAKELLEVKQTGVIPEQQKVSYSNLFEAIYCKDFDLALSLSVNYLNKNHIDLNGSILYLLLQDINQCIKETSSVRSFEHHSESKEPLDDSFASVVCYLMKQDFDHFFPSLNMYLKRIDKSQYESFFADLIKLSLLEHDGSFLQPMTVLLSLEQNNFSFDSSTYLSSFYDALSQNKLEESKVYLDILSKSSRLGTSCVETEMLEQLFSHRKEMLDHLEQKNAELKEERKVEKPVVESSIRKMESVKKNEIVGLPQVNADKELIVDKFDQLYQNGIVLMGPMESKRRKSIHRVVQSIPDVVSFSIGKESSRQVVLRHKPFIRDFINIPQLSKEGQMAYQMGDYDLCIEKFKTLLKFGTPKSRVYAMLGLAYRKKLDTSLAIDFLTVATELAKIEKVDFDYTGLINVLRGKALEQESKPNVDMTLDEFHHTIDSHYELENMNEIVDAFSSGMSFEEVCTHFDLNVEQLSTLRLILAREYFSQRDYDMGNRYLQMVEKTKHKSREVCSLYEEIRKNKNFYQNQVSDDYQSFVLKLNVKKN